MSSWSGGKKRPASSKGWRGKKSGPSKPAYAWQERPSDRSKRGRVANRRWEGQWRLYSLLGAGLLGLFLYLLLVRPAKTPVLMVIGTGYSAPVPPNGWVLEDRDALIELDKTLLIAEISGSWIGAEAEAWLAFRARLANHKALRRGFRTIREPLVIYFCMPGVVNKDGKPCLLPPGASPLGSDDWLTIESVVKQIAEIVPGNRPKLLVLDSNQELVNWDMGIVYNTFTERLKRYVERCGVANLAVLTAADEGQVSWASPQLGGSVFGQFLRLGLAGAADRDGPNPDDVVSLRELVDYLQAEVGGWAWSNRASKQQPAAMMSAPNLDFFVTHALGVRDLEPYRVALEDGAASQPSVSGPDIGQLWALLDQLRKFDVLRYDPIALGDYQNRLLRLERLAYGGRAYKSEAERAEGDLKHRLEQAVAKAKSSSPAVADYWAVTNPDAAASARLAQGLHSLSLREYFGQANKSASHRIRALWRHLAASAGGIEPSPFDSDSSLIQSALPFAETQLLVAAHQQRVREFGETSTRLPAVLDLRERAEQLAVPRDSQGRPGDERAHYYVRLAMDRADQKRRRAEDALFLEAQAPAAENQRALAVNRSYDIAMNIRDQTTEALAVCDQAWAETPYLAQWFCRPGGDGRFKQMPGNSDERIHELLSFIRDTHELGESVGGLRDLGQGSVDLGEVAHRLVTSAKVVQERHQQFRDEFKNRCANLSDGAVQDGAEMLAFESALASPLIDGALRTKLLEMRDDLAAGLHKEHFDSAGQSAAALAAVHATARQQPAKNSPATGTSTTIAEAMAKWDQSPLIAILDPEQSENGGPSGSSVLSRLEKDCWTARKKLLSLTKRNLQGAPPSDNSGHADETLNDRLALSRAERRIRAAAPLWFEPPKVDTIAQLRRFDLQQLLLWHTKRALDGFWHTVTSSDPKTIQELIATPVNSGRPPTPYFSAAAADYLRIAKQLHGPLTTGVRLQMDSLKQLHKDRLAASQYGLQLGASSQPAPASSADVEVKVEIEPYPKGPNLPSGLAAVYLADAHSRLSNVSPVGERWGSVDVQIAAGAIERLGARAHGVTRSDLDAVVFFRGRQYLRRFAVNNLGGAVVQYEPPAYDSQSVILYGDQPNPPSVVFILDCSGSMDAEIKAPDGSVKSRMEVAVSVLETMLGELAKRRGLSRPRIGVWFFGHRVAWKLKVYPYEIVYSDYAKNKDGSIPKDLNYLAPAQDVERVLPLGAFRAQQLGFISGRLDRVRDFGLTPVNLTIRKALAEFDDDDDKFSKSIIVITDGKNDQWHPPGTGYKAVQTTTPESVIKAWDRVGKEIPVYIVGFGIPKNDQQAELEFKKIADHTGGDWLPTDSGADLIDYLRKQLKVHGYVVLGPNGRPVVRDASSGDPKPIELNTEVDVSMGDFPLPIGLEVAFQSLSKRVTLEGGEKLELQVNRNGDNIIPVPYDVDVAQSAALVRGPSATPTNLLLRIHRPRRSNDRVKFRVSVQDQKSHFTPRPKEVWVEVSAQGSKESYVFYETVYEPLTPVPVVGFTASNWPPGVDVAQVKFWCSDQITPPVQSIPLSAVWRQDLQTAPFQTVPSVPQVEVRAGLETASAGADREYRVTVEERHQGKSASMGAIRIWLDITGNSLRPRSVSHRFDADNRIARHQYVFRIKKDVMTERKFAEKVTVRIASGATIKENSLQLERSSGLEVHIFNEDATHVPSAAGALPNSRP